MEFICREEGQRRKPRKPKEMDQSFQTKEEKREKERTVRLPPGGADMQRGKKTRPERMLPESERTRRLDSKLNKQRDEETRETKRGREDKRKKRGRKRGRQRRLQQFFVTVERGKIDRSIDPSGETLSSARRQEQARSKGRTRDSKFSESAQ